MTPDGVDVNWSGYVAFQPSVSGPWHELARRDARALFNSILAARDERVEALRGLLGANGVELHNSNEGVKSLEDWFRGHVTPDPTDPARPDPRWLAVAFDVGVFLGETMIARRPELRWELLTSPRGDVSYQRPVIVGFTDPAMRLDPVWRVSSLAFRVLEGLSEDDKSDFLTLLWSAKATEDWSPRQSF